MRWFHHHVLRLLASTPQQKVLTGTSIKRRKEGAPWKYDSMRILPYAAFRFCTVLLRLCIHKNNDYLNFVHTLFYAHRKYRSGNGLSECFPQPCYRHNYIFLVQLPVPDIYYQYIRLQMRVEWDKREALQVTNEIREEKTLAHVTTSKPCPQN